MVDLSGNHPSVLDGYISDPILRANYVVPCARCSGSLLAAWVRRAPKYAASSFTLNFLDGFFLRSRISAWSITTS